MYGRNLGPRVRTSRQIGPQVTRIVHYRSFGVHQSIAMSSAIVRSCWTTLSKDLVVLGAGGEVDGDAVGARAHQAGSLPNLLRRQEIGSRVPVEDHPQRGFSVVGPEVRVDAEPDACPTPLLPPDPQVPAVAVGPRRHLHPGGVQESLGLSASGQVVNEVAQITESPADFGCELVGADGQERLAVLPVAERLELPHVLACVLGLARDRLEQHPPARERDPVGRMLRDRGGAHAAAPFWRRPVVQLQLSPDLGPQRLAPQFGADDEERRGPLLREQPDVGAAWSPSRAQNFTSQMTDSTSSAS